MSATLDSLLLRDGIVDAGRLATAVEDARRTHKSLAETVIDMGLIDERRFAEWIAGVSGTQLVDPLPDDVPTKLERRLPPATARLRMVVPIGEEPWGLLVAMINPLEESTLEILRSTSGADILPVTGIRSAVERLVNRIYPEQLDGDATVMPNLRFSFNPDFNPDSNPEEPAAPLAPTPVIGQPPAFAEIQSAAPEPPVPAAEAEPFDFSTRTLLSSRSQLVDLSPEQPPAPPSTHGGQFGTLMAHPLPEFIPTETPVGTPPAHEVLARIEQRLDAISGAIERLQRRLDALDMTLMRFMNR